VQRPNLDASSRNGGRPIPHGEDEIEVDSIEMIGFPDITPELARESGFMGVLDLLKVAKHGRGENIYLVRFHYVPPIPLRFSDQRSEVNQAPLKSSLTFDAKDWLRGFARVTRRS
jgi:hypothetical protein